MTRSGFSSSDELQLLTIRKHEGGTIFSYEGSSERPLELLRAPLTSLIAHIQEEVEQQGGIIGHIKAYLSDSGASAVFSSVGEEIHITSPCQRETSIHFTAIVFACSEAPLAELIEEQLSAL